MNVDGTLAVDLPSDADILPPCREILARHARSFRLASVFLPPSVQDDAAIAYAFCRAVDDGVDDAGSAAAGRAAVDDFRAELLGKASARGVVSAWRRLALRRRIASRTAFDLLDGVESDLGEVRVADDAALLQYAYRVAGTVGLMMAGIVEVRERAALPHAVDLGVAMQLTNICRDVAEDAVLGRVYLPRTRLLAHGTTPEAILDGTAPPMAVAAVVRDVLALAERYYASADAGMYAIPWRARLGILAASRLYRAIGRKLARNGGDALAGRTVLGAGERALALGSALIAACTPTTNGWVARAHDATLHFSLRGLPGAAPSGMDT